MVAKELARLEGIEPPTHGLEGVGGVNARRDAVATYAAPLLRIVASYGGRVVAE